MKQAIKRIIGDNYYKCLWEHIKKPYLIKKAIRDNKLINFEITDERKKDLKPYGDGMYGTYFIIDDYLYEESIIYSFGIGMDASFDLNLIKKTNCKIYAFDPDRHAIDYVTNTLELRTKNFIFFPYAVSAEGGVKRFYEHGRVGTNDGSGSFVKYGDSTGIREVQSKSIKEIMSEFDHDHIDLLKMDIEGEEYEIINYLIENNIQVKQIAMELHGRFFDDSERKNEKLTHQLELGGYIPIWNQMWWYAGQECSFIHKSMLKY